MSEVPAIAEIAPAEANARLAEFHVVDVRAPHEFEGPLGRVPGAKLVPLPEIATRAAEIPADRPVLVVCRSGARSARACQDLLARGIPGAVNLKGGMIAWNRALLRVERTAPASLAALVASAVAWLAQVGGLEPAAARAALRQPLEAHGGTEADPTRDGVAAALAEIERLLDGPKAPADLDLSLREFRRVLAAL